MVSSEKKGDCMYILNKLYENGMEFVWFENMRIVDATIDVDFYKTNMKFNSLIIKALDVNCNYAKILFTEKRKSYY